VFDKDGRLLMQASPQQIGGSAPRVIDPRNAWLMTTMMQDVVRSGTAARAGQLGRSDIAGKTGTTNDAHDTWFAGYNPDLVAIAWMGFDQPRSLGRRETGSQSALPIWMNFMGTGAQGRAAEGLAHARRHYQRQNRPGHRYPPGQDVTTVLDAICWAATLPRTSIFTRSSRPRGTRPMGIRSRTPSTTARSAESAQFPPPDAVAAAAGWGQDPDAPAPADEPALRQNRRARNPAMKHLDMRRRIAHAAARILAEDGSLDYGSAKRKAARQLGAPDSGNLPDNQQIEEALRSYQALYQADETREQLALLRQVAIEYMERLADFDPHLTGPVLKGTAGRHAGITLQLFTDQQKDVEFLLMGLGTPYQAAEYRATEPPDGSTPASSSTTRAHQSRSSSTLRPNCAA
jgi:hypothetical protein